MKDNSLDLVSILIAAGVIFNVYLIATFVNISRRLKKIKLYNYLQILILVKMAENDGIDIGKDDLLKDAKEPDRFKKFD